MRRVLTHLLVHVHVLVLVLVLGASPARAQETSHGGLPSDSLAGPDALVDGSMTHSWHEGNARPFVATTVDAGYLYLRPRVSLGYGRPFDTWAGVDANPLVVSSGYGAYGGLRLAVPFFDVRIGARYFSAFEHAYLAPQTSYDRLAFDDTSRDKAQYLTLETELTGAIPVGPGEILALGSLSAVEGVPAGSYVFEETLHIIVAPPLVWRVRSGYALHFGAHRQHSVGLVADFLDVPSRDDSKTVRVGPVLRIALSRHFDVRGSFVMTVSGPDSLGLVGGDFTELGVRWRTATE